MLLPSLQVLGAIAGLYAAWWVLGDFVLDRIGIPHVDGAPSGSEVRIVNDAAGGASPVRDQPARRRDGAWSTCGFDVYVA